MSNEVPQVTNDASGANDSSNQSARQALSEAAAMIGMIGGGALAVAAQQAFRGRGDNTAPAPASPPEQPGRSPAGSDSAPPTAGPPEQAGRSRPGDVSPSTGGRPPENPNQNPNDGPAQGTRPPEQNRSGDAYPSPRDAQDHLRQLLDNGIENRFERHRILDTDFRITPADRTRAKEQLASELSELIPEADRQLMRTLQSAIIDGNMDQLRATLRTLAADPAKLTRFIDALNKQFAKHEIFNGIELGRDSQGNVLLYKEKGNTALSINPTSGDATVRAIEVQADGSVLLRPGEIINRQPADVLQAVADEATRAVVGPRFHDLPRPVDWYPRPDRWSYPDGFKERPHLNELRRDGSRSQIESFSNSMRQMLQSTDNNQQPVPTPSNRRPR
ncbi:MAG: hypothetical protein K2Z81_04870 [Cyanobacteria bacterium]|nr:hypothetical protein [Cyanobacteriota bacterium]